MYHITCFSSEDEFHYPEEEDDDEDEDEYDKDPYKDVNDWYLEDTEEIHLEPPQIFQSMGSADARIYLQVGVDSLKESGIVPEYLNYQLTL